MLRRAGIAAIALAALALTCAAPALAGSELVLSKDVPSRSSLGDVGLAGPVLGGDRVVWAERAKTTAWRIRWAPLEGARAASDTVRYAPAAAENAYLELAASPSHAAVSAHVYDCGPESCEPQLVLDQLAVNSGDRPFEVFESCPGAGCQLPCNVPVRWTPAFAGEVLAYNGDPCDAGSGIVWRDLAPGADHSPHHVAGRAINLAAAGRYLAWVDVSDPATNRIVVYDRVGDVEAYRVDVEPGPAIPVTIDVQDDGKIVYVDRDGLEWASVGEPSPHTVARSGFFQRPRIADDRVAYARPDFGRGRSAVRVVDLDGKTVASTTADGLAGGLTGGLDFDGGRVTFGTQPCQTAGVVVWEVSGPAPPRLPRTRCPAARIGHGPATRTPDDRLKLRLACSARAKLGCIGRLRLVANARGRGASGSQGLYLLGDLRYEIGRGRTRTPGVELTEGGRAFLDAHPRARLDATSISLRRPDLGYGHHLQSVHRTLRIEDGP